MEAVAVVGEAVLSASLEGLIKKLTSSDLLKFAKKEQVNADFKIWEKLLIKIHAVLEDAEEKQMTSRFVRIWLGDLRDLAYDMEDVLDELTTEALYYKVVEKPQATTSKAQKFITSCFSRLNPHMGLFKFGMDFKIKMVSKRLKQMVSEKDDLGLREMIRGRFHREKSQRIPSTSVVDECHVYGRERDKEAVLELVLRDGIVDENICVIPILGMAGVGKTTLAQLVFNNDIVNDNFEVKVWICVSEDFDVVKVTRAILQAITLENIFDRVDLNLLQVSLKEKLSGKKFLLVLDDVWNENYDRWEILCRPLMTAASGSKIIVTTRNEGVASITGNVPTYFLKVLKDDECLSLFLKHALGARNFDLCPNLKATGEEIVKRCKGLPLAAKALGGLLRSKGNIEEWKDVMNSKIWNLPDEKTGIFPALRLSYYHLPSYLKRCFAYCAIFPKDYEFNENELVLLWMAEGFIPDSEGKKKQKEDLGIEYFFELVSRSFFQQSSSNSALFVMHGLIHDLAQSIAEDVFFYLEDRLEESEKFAMTFEKVRYASFNQHRYDISRRFEVFYKMNNLRTFLTLPALLTSDSDWCYLPSKVLYDLLPRLPCLRVLSLCGYWIKELPDSIGDLKHLRSLNISGTAVRCLPESVNALINLQTLILNGCNKLSKLPTGTGNLINLRHLDINCTPNLKEMPLGIGKLLDLQTLPKFIVGPSDGLQLRELKDLLHLQKGLSITGLHNVEDVRDAGVANLKGKQGLDELAYEWFHNFDSRSERDEIQVLKFLEPHQNVKKLTISYYGGTEFPTWVADCSFNHLIHLELCNCKKSTSLPSLGRLPILEELRIRGMNAIRHVGVEFCGDLLSTSFVPFRSLKTLKFEDMLEWEEWSFHGHSEGRDFPNLVELSLQDCPKLNGYLPSNLMSLLNIHISKCPCLTRALVSLPSVHEMKLRECNEIVPKCLTNLRSLNILKIGRISRFVSLTDFLVQNLEALEVFEIQECRELTFLWKEGAKVGKLSSLKQLEFRSCSQLAYLESEDQEILPSSLEILNLVNCRALEKLPSRLCSLTCLRSLSIRRCGRLVSFPEMCLPNSLRHLQLINCDALKSLPDGVTNSKKQCFLEELEIQSCPSLILFPEGKLCRTIKSLAIRDCTNLQSLPEGMMQDDTDSDNVPLLEELTISGCPSLTSFPEGSFPPRLKTLHIWDLMQLESLESRMLQHNVLLECINIWNCTNLKILQLESQLNLFNLGELDISCCPSLESLDKGSYFPDIKSLKLENCENLKSLPKQLHSLQSLESLIIPDCPRLTSFPNGGLPCNLTKLELWNCENLKQPMSEWGLHRLASLQRLHLVGINLAEMVSFPDEEGFLLPVTLNFLYIERILNLESLSRGIRHLTSLVQLWITNCPNLLSLPKEGLPSTLGQLFIGNCPHLKRRCLKDKGEYWPILSNIPCSLID